MAVVSGTIMALKVLGKVAAKKVTMTTVKGMAKKAVKGKIKDTIKGKIKDKIKSKFKKKKLKGKDVAQKMFGGGEEGGGAIVASPSGSIVSSPAGGLIPSSSDTGGSLVESKSGVAKELGLEPFMNSLTSVKESVDSIKKSLNDNNKDAKDRIDDQRLLNNKFNKEEREAELENKKKGSGIGKKLLGPAKDVADNFLARMTKFFTMTLLGMLVNSLLGAAKDVVLAFRIGIEALKKGLPTLLKGVKALQSGIGKSFELALKPFKSLGKAVFEGFKTIGSKLFGWVSKSISNITQGIKNFGKNIVKTGSKFSKPVTSFVGNVVTKGKDFVKNTGGKILNRGKNIVKNVGSKIKSFLPGGGAGSKILKHGLKRGANRLIIKWFGKGAAKTLMSVGKTLVKGAKAIKIPVIGPLLVAITSMFSGDPIGKTLFKTAGAAIGGGLGLALGPIGMIVGEIAGEFVGDVLHEGFMGKDGWAGAGKKLKNKFMQMVKGGKVVLDWVAGGFGRFFKNFMEEHSFELPWWVSGPIKKLTGLEIGKLPNILQLYNPMAMGPLLVKSFFPPGEKKAEAVSTAATIGDNGSSSDAEDISESASYEDGGEEEPTVVIDGGGGQASSPPSSQEGESSLTVLGSDDSTKTLNTLSNAVLYKV